MKYNLYLRIIVRYCARRTGSADFFAGAVYYYRTFIARLFPQYEKAIYVDADTIFTGDVGELFDIDLGEKVIAARVDPKVQAVPDFIDYVEKAIGVPAKEYVNSGVLLMDLKKMRKIHYITRMTDLIKKYDADLVAPDQDYLNAILKGQILHLGKEWNCQPEGENPKNAKLLHFNLSKKPWFNDDVNCGEKFWEAARGTGFYGDLMREREEYTIEKARISELQIKALIDKARELAKSGKPIFEEDD